MSDDTATERERAVVADGNEWLRSLPDGHASMTYCDPPYGHGTFGRIDQSRLDVLVSEAYRVTTGIVYVHCDAEMLFDMTWPVKPRGMIVLRNGWISGFKTRATRWWPKHHQLIVGIARPEWRWRRMERARPENYQRRGGGGGGGFVLSDLWTDIEPVDQCSFSREKVGYPTQKPIALLERLIVGSTDTGDLVLDPMCGSGTTLVAAKRVGRRAAGADLSDRAVAITRSRLAT